jgi:hypothetical protein
MKPSLSMPRRRLVAGGIHLLSSACVAAVSALVVFLVWYPHPYASLAGGLGLFAILVSVDVVLGPALTFVAASPGKPKAELRRDIAIIIVIQIAGFAYGVHTIALARPVFLSFEIDRFRVVTAADIDTSTLAEAPPGLRSLPWTGPRLIAAVKPTDPKEQLRSIDLGLAGFDLSMIPRNWREFSSQSATAWRVARPVSALLAKYPALAGDVKTIEGSAGTKADDLRFLPVMSRRQSWVALLAGPDAHIVGYLPVDGFF